MSNNGWPDGWHMGNFFSVVFGLFKLAFVITFVWFLVYITITTIHNINETNAIVKNIQNKDKK